MAKHAEPSEQKPGDGVDRTQIRQLLALTPQERFRVMVESARNVQALMKTMRRIR